MFARLLSILFPPRLPGHIRDWGERSEPIHEEQGSASPARRKKYRNGIERHFAENPLTISHVSDNLNFHAPCDRLPTHQ